MKVHKRTEPLSEFVALSSSTSVIESDLAVQSPGYDQYKEAADYISQQTKHTPRVGMILGSGLNDLAQSISDADVFPFSDIPHFPQATVTGHSGKIYIGELEGLPVLVLRGRPHYYEGYSLKLVTLPIRVMQMLGLELIILTNAAGGVNKDFAAGDLMLIEDHLNMVGMMGSNPLMGPNDERLGPRFPDMSRVYDRELRMIALDVAKENGIQLHKGVYAWLSGPSFETPADIRFLRAIGADAVGMSTVPEAIVARHGGTKTLGISMISNVTIDTLDTNRETTHEEVLEAGALAVPRLETILRGVLRSLK